MARPTKLTNKKIAELQDRTKHKLPDGTRKYKMFKQTDAEAENAAQLGRYLLRHIDKNLLECMTHEEKDNEGNVVGSEVVFYTRDDAHGDVIFTVAATYIDKSTRDENDSHNEVETHNNKED